jgi:FkbM family methyltransferase
MIDAKQISAILPGHPESPLEPSSRLALLTDQAIVELIIKPYFDFVHPDLPMRMVDVGAAYGSVASVFFDAGWRIDAFEPDPTCRKILEGRFPIDSATIRIWPFAVDSVDRSSHSFVQNSIPGLSGLDSSPFGSDQKTLEIKTVRLDTFFRAHGIDKVDFLKIDTEGNDIDVLFSNDFSHVRPELIFIEYSLYFARQTPQALLETISDMNAHGYDCVVFEYEDLGNFSRGSWQHWLTRIHANRPPYTEQNKAFGNILFYDSRNVIFEEFFLQKLSLIR